MSGEMSARQFRHWRKKLGLSQKEAAKALGLKARMVQYYEKGEREGKKVEVPLPVRLACWSLQNGVVDFDGTDTTWSKAAKKASAPPDSPEKSDSVATAE